MSSTLRNRRVLVVEDEYMIAEEIAKDLGNSGADVLGPVSRIGDALRLMAAENRIDGALVDVNLGGQAVWPVVDALLERGVPLVLATGYDAGSIPAAYASLPRCEKPASGKELIHALAKALIAATPNDARRQESA